MKIAIVHDSLVEFGGAERVLKSLLRIFPTAHIYTAFVDPRMAKRNFSEIQSDRIHVRLTDYHFWSIHTSLFQMLAPWLWNKFVPEGYDLVIASSGHLMANLVSVPHQLFVQYIHSPPKNVFSIEPATPLQRVIPYTSLLRYAYTKSIRSADLVLTNSLHMKRVLDTLFTISSFCVYPPVFVPRGIPKKQQAGYYLVISRLDRSKSIELAIHACNDLQENLVIIGTANEPEYERHLHTIAGPTIQFTGFQPDEHLEQYYVHAKAFLFPSQNEDFGIAPIEAMAYGVPVIAYSAGGSLETVVDQKT